MKYLIILSLFFLTGCATTKSTNIDLKVYAPEEIMKSCEQYVLPSGPYFSDLIKDTVKNKKIYEDCIKLNEAKKKFIEDNLQK